MRAAFGYHGGKSRYTDWITQYMPEHTTYVEPFAGSAAVLLAKRPAVVEVINDLDGAVCAFFTALRDTPAELERVCALTPYSREEFLRCRRGVDEPGLTDVERARRFFTIITQGFGSVPTSSGWSPPTLVDNEAAKVGNLIDRFHVIGDRLRSVHIECRHAAEVMAAYDHPDTLHYVDPPYLWQVRSWAAGQSKKADYRIELQSNEDHIGLAETLVRLKGAVILSGKPHPLYDNELYKDWWTVDGPNGERLWSNRPLMEHLSLF